MSIFQIDSGNEKFISDPANPAEADVYAKGNISLTGNAPVKSVAAATGSISLSGNAMVTCTKIPLLSPPLRFYLLDTAVYLAQANSGHPDVNALKAQAQAERNYRKELLVL